MNNKLIIAAIACLGLVACQQQGSDEKKAEEKPAAEQSQPSSDTAAPAGQAAPAEPAPAPGTSYYDNQSPAQNVAEQANPAIDSQQETAQADNNANAFQMSQQTDNQETD